MTRARFVSAIRRGLDAAPPVLILVAAWLVLLLYAYPGQMTRDSFDHLFEARSGVYTDAHPPAISLLWRAIELVVKGPAGMLVVQSATFLAGLYLVTMRVFAPRRAAWIAAAVFLFPPIGVAMAVIWKDCLMAGLLMLAVGCLLSPRPRVRLLALVFVFGATAVRYNTPAATLPLLVVLLRWPENRPWFVRGLVALVAWIGVTVAAVKLNDAITDHRMYFWHSSVAVHDIVGTLSHVDGTIPDAELEELFRDTDLVVHHDIHATARRVYFPHDHIPVINDPKDLLWALPINGTVPAPTRVRDALARAWWETITTYPGAYARHRLAVMSHVLSIGDPTPPGAITRRDVADWHLWGKQLGIEFRWSRLQYRMTRWVTHVWRYTRLFVPWIYAVLAVVGVVLARRQRDTLALLLSALGFWGGLLLIAPSADYRYSHWPITCTVLAMILLFTRRWRAGSAQTLVG